MVGRIPVRFLILLTAVTACKSPVNETVEARQSRKVELQPVSSVDNCGWQESLRFPVGMARARGVAVTEAGHILVVGDNHLHRYSRTGNLERQTELDGKPAAVAASGDDRVLVAYDDHLEVLGDDDLPVEIWDSAGETALLSGIATTETIIFAADAGTRTVLSFSPDGRRIGELEHYANTGGDEELVVPSRYLDVVIGPGGLVLVNNPGRHRVEAHANGRKVFEWGRPGPDPEAFPGCCNPIALVVLPDGDVVTAQKGQVRIKQYSIEGQLKAEIAGPDAYAGQLRACAAKGMKSVDSGLDLAVDDSGKVYALEPCGGEIRTYKATRRKPGGPDTGLAVSSER